MGGWLRLGGRGDGYGHGGLEIRDWGLGIGDGVFEQVGRQQASIIIAWVL